MLEVNEPVETVINVVRFTIISLIILLTSSPAQASTSLKTQSVAVDLLIGSDQISGLRLAYRPLTRRIDSAPYFEYLDIYWEISVNFWEYGENNQHQANYAIALSPVISKTFYYVQGKYPLRWEFGIGISLVEDTQFAGKNIGSHYQFEDRLGLSFAFGANNNQRFAIRYMHYSNGGLNSNNPGLDFFNASYSVSF